MEGRESTESNNIFFVCSFIEYLARKTKNTRKDTVNAFGKKNIEKLYDLADVFHYQCLDETIDDFSNDFTLSDGNFDNIAKCEYSVPDYWDMGRVYCNLIVDISKNRQQNDFVGILLEVYSSWITEYLDDYNSNMYYSNPDYIFQSYKAGEILSE